ncbi:MAG TPA: hypothetical protein VJW20_04480 [Candidatus Angelobacter sp.]|nr:hypothetical protein [Candidatus Angelobacter sp.]
MARTRSSSTTRNDLAAAKAEWSQRLFHAPRLKAVRLTATPRVEAARALTAATSPDPQHNVVGVGVGWKISDGKDTGVMAVKFFVRMKYPESEITNKHLLPKSIHGLPVDVEESGLFRRFATVPNPREKIRPAQPGGSVGFQDPQNQFVMAGTFGALVKDRAGSYVLSNNHVLADENRLPVGSPIFQPGLLDNGNPATDSIASFTRTVPLQLNAPNQVDCAIAKLLRPSLAKKDVLFIGPPQGTATAAIDMSVHKFGRTTSYTAGRVTSIDTDVTVQYETGNFTFAGQIIIVGTAGGAFSGSGDSGSLIMERPSNAAVGLLFAGSASHTIANHIGDVLKALNVTLA